MEKIFSFRFFPLLKMAEIIEVNLDVKHAAEADDIIWGLDMPRITFGLLVAFSLVCFYFAMHDLTKCLFYNSGGGGKVKKRE